MGGDMFYDTIHKETFAQELQLLTRFVIPLMWSMECLQCFDLLHMYFSLHVGTTNVTSSLWLPIATTDQCLASFTSIWKMDR